MEAVGSSSATGAAYGPLEASRQQLFFISVPISRKVRNPDTSLIICPLFRWVKITAAVVVAFRRSVAPRRPGALLYGRTPDLASAFLRKGEIFCPFLGRSIPNPGLGPPQSRQNHPPNLANPPPLARITRAGAVRIRSDSAPAAAASSESREKRPPQLAI